MICVLLIVVCAYPYSLLQQHSRARISGATVSAAGDGNLSQIGDKLTQIWDKSKSGEENRQSSKCHTILCTHMQEQITFVFKITVVVVGMVAGGLQLGRSAGSQDVRAVGGALDLYGVEEPAIERRRCSNLGSRKSGLLLLEITSGRERLPGCRKSSRGCGKFRGNFHQQLEIAGGGKRLARRRLLGGSIRNLGGSLELLEVFGIRKLLA
jgi:hypothetical protein